MNNTQQTNFGKKSFFFILLLIILFLGFKVILPYLSVIVLGFVTVFIFKPVYNFFLKLTKREFIATTLCMIVVILTFLVPMFILTKMTIDQTENVVTNISESIERGENPFQGQINRINEVLVDRGYPEYTIKNEKITQFLKDNIKPAANFILGKALDVGAILSDFMPKVIVYLFLVSALFSKMDKVLKYVQNLSPLSDEIDELYLKKVIGMSKSMVQGSFVIAVVQGILSGLLLNFLGIEYAFFLTLIMIFLSIIPLGAGIINLPIGLWLIILGNDIAGGLLIILNHFLVITNIDNILRPKLVSHDAQLNPTLTLIAVLGGVKAFGFMGVIYGPVIMIFLVTTFEVYLKYYREDKK